MPSIANAALSNHAHPRELQRAALALVALPVLLLAACASTPADSPHARVTVVKSASALPGPLYAWVEMPRLTEAEQHARVGDAAFRGRLSAALDQALQAKGYRLAESPAQADILVAYRVGLRDLVETNVQGDLTEAAVTPAAALQCGEGGCSQLVMRGEAGNPVVKIRMIKSIEGGLLFEVIEPGTIALLWSAYNRGMVNQGDGSDARLAEIATATLQALPLR